MFKGTSVIIVQGFLDGLLVIRIVLRCPLPELKGLANKIAILVFVLNTPTFYVLRINFRGQIFFLGLSPHPQDIQDEIRGLQFYLQTPYYLLY